ncbi:unnamed protein product [Absidia cylindrospora]
MAATSLLKRPLDLVYFVYFLTHIPVTFLIDFQVFYPPSIVPQVLKDALAMFVNDFKDPSWALTLLSIGSCPSFILNSSSNLSSSLLLVMAYGKIPFTAVLDFVFMLHTLPLLSMHPCLKSFSILLMP